MCGFGVTRKNDSYQLLTIYFVNIDDQKNKHRQREKLSFSLCSFLLLISPVLYFFFSISASFATLFLLVQHFLCPLPFFFTFPNFHLLSPSLRINLSSYLCTSSAHHTPCVCPVFFFPGVSPSLFSLYISFLLCLSLSAWADCLFSSTVHHRQTFLQSFFVMGALPWDHFASKSSFTLLSSHLSPYQTFFFPSLLPVFTLFFLHLLCLPLKMNLWEESARLSLSASPSRSHKNEYFLLPTLHAC